MLSRREILSVSTSMTSMALMSGCALFKARGSGDLSERVDGHLRVLLDQENQGGIEAVQERCQAEGICNEAGMLQLRIVTGSEDEVLETSEALEEAGAVRISAFENNLVYLVPVNRLKEIVSLNSVDYVSLDSRDAVPLSPMEQN